MDTIHIMALRHSAFYSPLLMTMAAGFLQRQGLEHTYTVATPAKSISVRLHSGACHVAQSAVSTGFATLEQGEKNPIVHFAQINERDGFFMTGRQPHPEFQWSDLQGKQVLVDQLFQPLAMLKYVLHQHDVDYASLEVIDAGDVIAMDKAFRDGVGDYVHQQGPAPQQIEYDGKGHIVASVGEAIGPVAFSSLCCQREWLHTDMAKAFTRAYIEALEYTVTAPAQDIGTALQQAGFFPEIHPEVLIQTVDRYKTMGCWRSSAEISPAAYDKLVEIFTFNGLISKSYSYDTLIAPLPA